MKQQNQEIPMNMTPMIDVVFLLIIFFMIVVDLSQQELENIILPRASQCQKDDPTEESRKIINVRPTGEIIVKRKEYALDQLENNLFIWRQMFREEDKDGFCEKPILIRTDRGTEMRHVQKIMEICGKERLKIWKIELACSGDTPGLHTREDPREIVFIDELEGQ